MADWYAASSESDGNHRAGLHLAIWQDSYDSATGLSFVKWYLDYYDNASNYGGTGRSNWSANINGTTYSGSVAFDFSGNSGRSYRLVDNTAGTWVSGTSVGGSGHVDANSPVGTTDVSGTLTLATLPSAPYGAPSMSRSTDGATVTVISQGANANGITLSGYEVRFSTDGSNWGYQIPMNQGGYNLTGATQTVIYYAQTRAVNINGYAGPWSVSGSIAGIPAAPSSLTAVRSARSVTLTGGGSPSNGGSTITGYYVQRSSDGVTWTDTQTINSGTYTYLNLTSATTWIFRIWCVNSIGRSAYTNSYGVFVPAGGKRYDGTAFQTTSISRRFDGTAWNDIATAARFDGTNWVYLS